MADLQAGRLVDGDTVAARLGGWQMARVAPFPPIATVADRAPGMDGGPGNAHRLLWTATAMADCDRLHRILAALGEDARERFAATLVAAMVRLVVDGTGDPGPLAEVAVFPSLTLRIRVTADAIIVLRLRPVGAIS